MPSVSIHPPKTPVTKGSNGIAQATIPNVCKMPGPPAPFVPSPLPNIAKSAMSPQGYSTTVKIEGQAVAIRGATFESMGDIASKGTGGGLLSANTQGPAKFITPGSMTVQIQGKSVHLLGEPMLNNCGPGGSPPNTGATMAGVVQGTATASFADRLGDKEIADALCDAACKAMEKDLKQGQTRQGEMAKEFSGNGPLYTPNNSKILPEVTQRIPAEYGGGMTTMLSETGRTITGTNATAPMSMFKAMSQGRPGGTTVRWDFVIPENPGKAPTMDNIKKIVEVKYPGDDYTKNQIKAADKMSQKEFDKIEPMYPEEDCVCTK